MQHARRTSPAPEPLPTPLVDRIAYNAKRLCEKDGRPLHEIAKAAGIGGSSTDTDYHRASNLRRYFPRAEGEAAPRKTPRMPLLDALAAALDVDAVEFFRDPVDVESETD